MADDTLGEFFGGSPDKSPGESLDVTLAGEALVLLAGRALYWPRRRRLLIADLHLGKDAAFRRAGIALPDGGTMDDLDRLAGLASRCGAAELWVLGDLLHGPPDGSAWRAAWAHFRNAHPALDIVLVQGNHDRAIARAGLAITTLADPVDDPPFLLGHAPTPDDLPDRFGICGHVHPVVRVPGLPGRFPAFVIERRRLILPAFSAFTGGWQVDEAAWCYACIAGELLALGPVRRRGRRR